MTLDSAALRPLLQACQLPQLFNALGWDNFRTEIPIPIDGVTYSLAGVAEKRGVQVFRCAPGPDGKVPARDIRAKLDTQLRKSAHEHLIVFTSEGAPPEQQLWQWVELEPGKPRAIREHALDRGQTGDPLLQKLSGVVFDLAEEEQLTLAGDVIPRIREAFGRRDRVTKRFYERFSREHQAFLAFIKGIRAQGDQEWYASVMLNRLMFIYFIQRKGFLDGNQHYLRAKLAEVRSRRGSGQFFSFYRTFLRRLFHEGLAGREHSSELTALIGNVPYLNGGIFDVHQLERDNDDIDVADEAFDGIFDFFDSYEWHLDDRALRNDGEINPDVLGYIFEKYINQKQMGAYYTKEDITGYITQNTVIPFLLDATRDACRVAFEPNGAVWRLLRDDPDRYIYDAVRKGVDEPLPADIEAGITDVSKRGGWNRPAEAVFALPTETWREHVARRTRCLGLRAKLAAGEVVEVNELITLNLNIRQFAQDVIERSEGPDVSRAFYHAIEKVSVLDPTCGSGAFLFAALNILQPLYDACLNRMEAWIEDQERLGRPPGRDHFFRQTLARVALHPNREYFVLKSIIIENLYGVDIMEEAVEICKLRLFLKLVAQVEGADQLEPLPDIDFNIRAGNTLVGFTSLEAVREAMSVDGRGNRRLLFAEEEADLRAIEESAEVADRAYQRFREQQTIHGGAVTSADKLALRARLEALDAQLDVHLARQYGVDPTNARALNSWRDSHQPFHWFVEFFGVMSQGGFDAIVGNPPYIELRELPDYQVRGYSCAACGNLYAVMIERCESLTSPNAREGFIVPVSSISTDRYSSLQELLSLHELHYSSYDDRPSRLFDGLEHIRLTIHLVGPKSSAPRHFSTRYNKWSAEERSVLFPTLVYLRADGYAAAGSLPKLTSPVERSLLAKISGAPLGRSFGSGNGHEIHYSRKIGYFVQVLDFEPMVLDGAGERRPPSEFKALKFSDSVQADAALCALNATLFFWYLHVFSDCRHVNRREVERFPVGLSGLTGSCGPALSALARTLMTDIRNHAEQRTMRYGHDTLSVQHIFLKPSKPVLDEIDRVLGGHYGFTDEELDFIINYDIKYRMGTDSDSAD